MASSERSHIPQRTTEQSSFLAKIVCQAANAAVTVRDEINKVSSDCRPIQLVNGNMLATMYDPLGHYLFPSLRAQF